MIGFRFSDRAQKEVHLATLRDLMLENHCDQIAKTVLSNAAALSESVMVTGELDEMIERTNRMHRMSTIGASVFFVAFGFLEVAFAYIGPYWPALIFALAAWFYAVALVANYRIQNRYYTHLRWMQDLQLELPATPFLRESSKAN